MLLKGQLTKKFFITGQLLQPWQQQEVNRTKVTLFCYTEYNLDQKECKSVLTYYTMNNQFEKPTKD